MQLRTTLRMIVLSLHIFMGATLAGIPDLSDFPPCALQAAVTYLQQHPNGCNFRWECECKDVQLLKALPTIFGQACPPAESIEAMQWARNACLKYANVSLSSHTPSSSSLPPRSTTTSAPNSVSTTSLVSTSASLSSTTMIVPNNSSTTTAPHVTIRPNNTATPPPFTGTSGPRLAGIHSDGFKTMLLPLIFAFIVVCLSYQW